MNKNLLMIPLIFLTLIFWGCANTKWVNSIINGDLNSIKKFIASDKNKIFETDKMGRTPLHIASAYGGHIEIVQYLVSAGADVNAQDPYMNTPLHQAVIMCQLEIVEYLISQGANVNSKNNAGRSPLHNALICEHPEIVKFLIEKGADVNSKDYSGDTPLHYAAKNGLLEIAEYLVSQGADLSIENGEYKTPFKLAELYQHPQVASFLYQINTDIIKREKIPRKAVFEDKIPPQIDILSHDTSRTIKTLHKEERITIKGRVQDEGEIVEVKVDNKPVKSDENGNFVADVDLEFGENQVIIEATDRFHNRGIKTLTIVREAIAQPIFDSNMRVSNFNNYALIIGNNDYKYLRRLKTAINDAQEVADVLRLEYNFETRLLLNATRNDIVDAINNYRKILRENDNFLIYYAGHGEFDKIANRAYWLPVDAQTDNDTNWILADTITSNIRRISSKHILIIADSCYSGALTRKALTDLASHPERNLYLKKVAEKKSRTLLASGGNEPVADVGAGGHSAFAISFLQGLKNMEEDVFTAEELFYLNIKERVAGTSDQIPEYNIIMNSGHEGGDFIFLRTNN